MFAAIRIMRGVFTLAPISFLFYFCISVGAQEATVVRVGVSPLRSGVDAVSVTEARDRLVEALNQHKTDKALRLSIEAVALETHSGPAAIAEAQEKNCQFILSTHLTNLATTYEATELDGVNIPDYHAFVEYQLNRVADGSGFAVGSINADDSISIRDAIWRALSKVAIRASSEIRNGKGMADAPAVAGMPQAPATASLVYTGDARDYCKWLPSDLAHADSLHGACEYAISLPQKMPNFICDQNIARYRGYRRAPVDLISAAIRYEGGQESYSEVKVNGRSLAAGAPGYPGLRSKGEFGGDLRAIFNRSNQARFKYTSEGKVGDHAAWIFAYKIVEQKEPLWLLQAPGQITAPPYSGELWIDAQSGVVLRFRSVAEDMPRTFPMKSVDLQIDYENVEFGDGTNFVLPADSTLVNEFTGEDVSRNEVRFRNCHKFRAQAHMVLGAGAEPPAKGSSAQSLPDLASLQKDLRESEAIFAAISEQAVQESEVRREAEQKQMLDANAAETLEKWSALLYEQQLLQGRQATTKSAASDREGLTTLKVAVNLVLVSVVARDGKGHAVGNLGKQNFQLIDEGKPQAIKHFSVEAAGAGTSPDEQPALVQELGADHVAGSQNRSSAPDRDTAYLFDDVHLSFADLAAARAAAARHLGSLRTGERAAIFTTSGAVVLDFTDAPDQLLAALGKLKPHGRIPESDCPPITYYMADLMLNKQDSEARSVAVAEATDCAMRGSLPSLHAQHLAAAKALEVLNIGNVESKSTLTVLKNVIRRIEAMPGQRSIVVVSPGFLALTGDTHEDVMAIIDGAVHAGIVVNSLDASGLSTGGFAANVGDPQFDVAEAQARSDVMTDLAYGTGGTFFHNNNDLDEGFRRTDDVPEYLYALGFSPQKLDGKFHKLKVRLNAPEKLTVQARQGYYALKPASAP